MRRVSIPIEDSLFKDIDNKIPHGMKAGVIRSAIALIMKLPNKILWEIASGNNLERFEIVEKTDGRE